MPLDDRALDRLAAFRTSVLAQSPGYPGPASATAFHRATLVACETQGGIVAHEGPEGLDGLVMWQHERDAPTGVPTTWLSVHRKGAEALSWAMETFDAVWPTLQGEIALGITAWDVPLRRAILRRGLGIQGVNMAGRVDIASERLGHAFAPLPSWLEVVPVEAPAILDGVIDLRRRVFSAEPAFCWFGAGESYLAAERAQLANPTKPGFRRALVRDGEVVGFVACGWNDQDPHHGRSAGVDLLMDRSLRGLGVSRHAYRWMLDAAVARGTEWLKGITAQPPVLHMARRLGRIPTGLSLRVGSTFDEAHFSAFDMLPME